jgi:hypothetical protein
LDAPAAGLFEQEAKPALPLGREAGNPAIDSKA